MKRTAHLGIVVLLSFGALLALGGPAAADPPPSSEVVVGAATQLLAGPGVCC